MTTAVIELVRARMLARSMPGARADAARLALCIEGGAMRGVVSAGMIAAVEQLGLLRAFDLVIGSSAGAANGAYLVAGNGLVGSTIYYENINNRAFINARRAFTQWPVVDLDYLVHDVMVRQKPLDTAAILHSPIPLVIVASNVRTGEGEALRDFVDAEDVLGCLRASATMPVLAGAPYVHRGRHYWDGSLTQPIPLDAAVQLRCTHVLALLTRPRGVGRPDLSFFQRRFVLPRIRRVSPALAVRFSRQREEYENLVGRLEAPGAHTHPHVLALRPAGSLIRNLERRHGVLVDGATQGFAAVAAAFETIARAAVVPPQAG